MGFSREWVQIASKRITNVPKIARKEIEDLLKTGLASLPPLGPLDHPETRNHEIELSNWIRLLKLAKLINLMNLIN